MNGQSAVLQVVILRDGLLVGTEVFVPGSYTIGSSPQADLRLDDPTVSEFHAALYYQQGRAAVQDTQSATGVFVNGHKVSACELRPVDELACGPFILKVRSIAQRPRAPGPSSEISALLGARPPEPAAPAGPARPPSSNSNAAARPQAPSAPPATVVSARRLAAVPAAPPAPSPEVALAPESARPASHLRAVEANSAAVSPNVVVDPDVALELDPEPTSSTETTQAVPFPTQLFEDTTPGPPPPAPPAARRAPAARPAAAAPGPSRSAQPSARAGVQPAPSPAPKPAPSPARRPAAQPAQTSGARGDPRLFLELYWGTVRRHARSFGKLGTGKSLSGAHDEKADFPLYGFTLDGTGKFDLAEQVDGTYRLYVPAGAVAERRRAGETDFAPVPPAQLELAGRRRYLNLGNEHSVRLSEGQMLLVATVQRAEKAPFINPLARLPWLVLVLLVALGAGFGWFLKNAPQLSETADFQQKGLPPVAVRLMAPEPKKKEEAKKRLAAIKEKAAEKAEAEKKPVAVKEKKEAKKEPSAPPPPEQKAFQALAKLTSAGPASKDLLAAVDKLGNGPGSRNAKGKDFKLAGLIGKAPIANAGLGTFGLGGGGAGGLGTKGAELLRGAGGAGIGALGAGNIGKGAVGATVTRATARAVAVQGSIDREAVAKTVNAHLQEVRACYERALIKDPGLAGKVVLEWTISTAGKVVAAKTKSSSLRNSAVEGCILTSLKGWQFPPAKGGTVIVSYPFMFNSVGY